MRVLILGASGMAGHTITMYFLERGHNVTTITRNPFSFGENINLNLSIDTISDLKKLIQNNSFDAIINCVGILNKDADENKQSAVFLNSYLPHFLSETTENSKTKVIQMSTDCVFSGLSGSYKENSFRDGKTFYDRTKALGELEDKKNLTFRNSIIGPDINPDGIGLFNWFMKQNGTIKGFEKAIWTGVTTLTLAKAMEAAIQQNLTGLYNLVNNESINKYQLLNLFNETFKQGDLIILPDNNLQIDKSLVNTRRDFEFIIPTYNEMIFEMEDWINKHKSVYPHYLKKE